MVYNILPAGHGKMEIIEERLLNATRVRVIRGDITTAPVDAIVNAANSHLQHGGGVAGAIVRKGGSIIQEESDRIGYVPVGESAVTTAGRLPAKYVIHTVGPRWGEGDEEAKLRSAVRNTLELAEKKGFATIAMPAISAGIFGFPKDRCAHIILNEIAANAARTKTVKEIDLYLMDPEIIGLFAKELSRIREA
jgi:O-acetyl-ADP-ribose deacetylase (regulator of RNase III)